MDGNSQKSNARMIASSIPTPAKRLLTAGYYRYSSWKADQSHESHRIGEVEHAADSPNHVIIVVLDALRPDFEPDLPTKFGRAITPGTWTFPAVTSIHTGTYPHEHEAVAHTHPDDDAYVIPKQSTPENTLPHIFESAGFDTYSGLAFMTPFLAIKGWYTSHQVYRDVGAEKVVNDYRKWREGREKTFAYLHLGDLHAPIEPPQEFIDQRNVDTEVEQLSNLTRYTDDYDNTQECRYFREQRLLLYRAALDYTEEVLEELFSRYGGDSVIVVTGDHGEAHWEHYEIDQKFTDSRPNYGVGHGGTPFDMVARVPVAIQTPSQSIIPQGGHGSLLDLSATLCREMLVGSPLDGCEWQSPIPEERAVICEATRYGAERKAVYQNGSKVIRSQTDDVTITSQLMDDARESFDVSVSEEKVQSLLNELPDYWADGQINSNTSRMVEDQLSALGYK